MSFLNQSGVFLKPILLTIILKNLDTICLNLTFFAKYQPSLVELLLGLSLAIRYIVLAYNGPVMTVSISPRQINEQDSLNHTYLSNHTLVIWQENVLIATILQRYCKIIPGILTMQYSRLVHVLCYNQFLKAKYIHHFHHFHIKWSNGVI